MVYDRNVESMVTTLGVSSIGSWDWVVFDELIIHIVVVGVGSIGGGFLGYVRKSDDELNTPRPASV